MLPVLFAALTLTAPSVNVTRLTGSPVKGEVTALSSQFLTVETEAGEQQIPIKTLRSVVFSESKSLPRKAGPFLELTDGSVIRAKGYRVVEGVATVALSPGEATVPTKVIRGVLFRDQSDQPKLQRAWRDLLAAKHSGDQVIVRRSKQEDGKPPVLSLDNLEVVLRDISATTVNFGLDDEKRTIAVEKLEGLIYFHPAGAALGETICRVTDASGSIWAAAEVELGEAELSLKTPAGVQVALPAEKVVRIDFDSGNVVYLSDLTPETLEWTPYIETRVSLERLTQMFGPHRDEAFGRRKLRLEENGAAYDKGLSIHSRTKLTYRLTENFKRLQAKVGLDPKYRKAGDLELIILGEDRELFRRRFTADLPPQELDLAVKGVRRLTILVEFGEKWDIADHLNLCDVRLTK